MAGYTPAGNIQTSGFMSMQPQVCPTCHYCPTCGRRHDPPSFQQPWPYGGGIVGGIAGGTALGGLQGVDGLQQTLTTTPFNGDYQYVVPERNVATASSESANYTKELG